MATSKEIIELYQKLKAGRKVAEQLHVGEATVYKTLREHGIEPTGLKEYRERIRRFDKSEIDRLIKEYESGISAAQLAEQLGCSTETVLNYLRASMVVIRSQKPPMVQAEKEEAKMLYMSGMTFKQVAEKLDRHENTICALMNTEFPDIVRSGTIGPGSPHWLGGKTTSHGYVYVWVGDDDPMVSMRGSRNYVLEHRLVLARKLGRPLRPTETVHHIDGNSANNSPENLELRQGKHGKHTAMVCLDCGSHNVGHRRLS